MRLSAAGSPDTRAWGVPIRANPWQVTWRRRQHNAIIIDNLRLRYFVLRNVWRADDLWESGLSRVVFLPNLNNMQREYPGDRNSAPWTKSDWQGSQKLGEKRNCNYGSSPRMCCSLVHRERLKTYVILLMGEDKYKTSLNSTWMHEIYTSQNGAHVATQWESITSDYVTSCCEAWGQLITSWKAETIPLPASLSFSNTHVHTRRKSLKHADCARFKELQRSVYTDFKNSIWSWIEIRWLILIKMSQPTLG